MIQEKVKENLLNKLMKRIVEEQNNIKKANEIDNNHYPMNVEIKKLLEISEELKNQDLSEDTNQDVIVIHEGSPYVSYILAVKAIYNEINMKICVNETMLATNIILIKIIDEVRKEMRIKTLIEIERDLELTSFKNDENHKIIVLGDKLPYIDLLRNKVKNIHYRANYNISLYVQNEQLEELKQKIIDYCMDNFIEIEVYEANDIKDAIKQLEADNEGEQVMMLTDEKVEIETNIKINLNENILKNIEKELIKEKIL